MESTYPKSFICPITYELIKEAITCPDGHTYEKSAIYKWVKENGNSPLTKQPLTLNDLVPNCFTTSYR